MHENTAIVGMFSYSPVYVIWIYCFFSFFRSTRASVYSIKYVYNVHASNLLLAGFRIVYLLIIRVFNEIAQSMSQIRALHAFYTFPTLLWRVVNENINI